MKKAIICILAVTLAASFAKAETLSGSFTVDNGFTAYLSTSATVQGTELASGENWTTAFALPSTSLVSGQTYFLQIDAYNTGGPGSLVGDFNLSDSTFGFSNGTQSLHTDTTDWSYSSTGFGANPVTPASYYFNVANNGSPWGVISGISSDAQWIWDGGFSDAGPLYFETEITPLSEPGATPEPGSLTLLGSGIMALAGAVARRHRTV